MYEFSDFGKTLSVEVKGNTVTFWVENHGENTRFDFDLALSEDMQKFCDLIRYLKDIKTYVTLNGLDKTHKDQK